MADTVRHFPKMKCFVLMPYGSRNEYGKGKSEADFVYRHIIRPAAAKALDIEGNEDSIVREVDNGESGLITKAIIQRIAEASLVIADISGHNANVFFEMGVRYSLQKRSTILIRQSNTPIPFDLANFRHHTYELLDDNAAEKLADAITATINAGISHTDSPVYELYPGLEVNVNSASDMRMPWNEFTNRLDKIREYIFGALVAGTYSPDAIIGITKGGAMFADFLTQKMARFNGATLALWADRNNSDSNYFHNSINASVLEGLKEHCKKPEKELRILLVDEVVASGTTYKSAIKLIMELIPNCHLRFLPMVYRENQNYELVSERILWTHHAFKLSADEINQIHLTNWISLPWGKDIRRS